MFGKLVRFGEVVKVCTHYYSTGWGDMCCGRSACELTKTFILFGFDDLDCIQSKLSKMSKYLYFFYTCVQVLDPPIPKSVCIFVFSYLWEDARTANPQKCLYFHICVKVLALPIPIVVDNFAAYYDEQKLQAALVRFSPLFL